MPTTKTHTAALPYISNVSSLEAYRGVWALCTVDRKTKRLKATHVAYPVVYGREPLWVVATINGTFVRWAGGRGVIEKAYPHLAWRRWMVRWAMIEATDHSIAKRLEQCEATYERKPPRHS